MIFKYLSRSNSYSNERLPPENMSPVLMEQILNEQSGSKVDDEMIVETTFGVDGEIESSPVRKIAPKVTTSHVFFLLSCFLSWLL